ncbi:hypothetical protein [Microbacterium testaceum]|uniref:hypothetical protein n=1 Tax=Microbacterium testaceum TaxID=2033 RepID=UPI00380FFF21
MKFPLGRVLLAMSARLATAPLTAISAAVSTYIAVHYAGVETFGFISLLGTLFLLIPFSDLGLGAAVVNAVSVKDRGPSEDAAARDVTARAFRALALVGIGVIAIAALLSVSSAWRVILAVPPQISGDLNFAAFCVFLAVGVGIPFGLGQRILVGANATHLSTLIMAISSIIAVAVTAITVALSGPPLLISTATPIGLCVAAFLSTAAGLRRLKWSFPELMRARVPVTERNSLWKPAVPMMVVLVGAPLALQSHRLILAHYGAPSDLAQYSVGAQFYAPALSIVTTGALALWPHFASTRTGREGGWKLSVLLMGALGLFGATALTLLLAPISQIVTGGRAPVGAPLAIGFGVLLLVMSLHQPSAMLLTDASGLWFQAGCIVAFAITTVPASILAVGILGASGPLFATAATVTVTTLIPCILRARKVLRKEL